METDQNLTTGKNELWAAYRDAEPLVRDEIILELKKADLFRHWQGVASKEGYDLKYAKAPLRDIFLKLLPKTAHLFGLKPPPKAHKAHKPVESEGTLRLFE